MSFQRQKKREQCASSVLRSRALPAPSVVLHLGISAKEIPEAREDKEHPRRTKGATNAVAVVVPRNPDERLPQHQDPLST